MKNLKQAQRTLRFSAALVAFLLPAIAAHARAHKSGSWADSQFAAAEHLQEALEGRPTGERTRRDYERVINAYRRVYLGAPSSGRADPSVVAAAQMTEEMGRRFSDPDILRSAIQQYEFLRREYPGSKFRFDALFRIGEIYKDDLHDKTRSDAAFKEFLRRYPRNQFAEAARQALAEPAQQQASLRSKDTLKAAGKDSKPGSDSGSDSDDDALQDNSIKETGAATEPENGKPARVIAIRHWSTPDYTRVAIDLEHGVKYQSQRIDNPDRIFFDLLNTKLDPKLAGKTLDVSDGLLKAIRTSQFKTGRTRVVLDLDDLSEFDASLLSNPARLIIDIHSKDIHSKSAHNQQAAVKDVASATETAAQETPSDNTLPDSLSTADDPPASAKAVVEKPVRRNTVVVSNGVKKTIVEADDGDVVAKDTVAKLDLPKLDPPRPDPLKLDPPKTDLPDTAPATKVASTSPLAVRPRSNAAKGKHKTSADDMDIREAQPTASGDRSLIRALGLKIGKIVIDPGHGGHDTGTVADSGGNDGPISVRIKLEPLAAPIAGAGRGTTSGRETAREACLSAAGTCVADQRSESNDF